MNQAKIRLPGPARTVALLLTALQPALAQPPAIVDTLPVELRNVSQTIELVGTAEPNQRSEVAAQTSGAVLKRHVEEGDSVSAGTLLATLDPDILTARLESAQATAAAAEAQHAEQVQRMERSQSLFSKGRISQEEFEGDTQREESLKQIGMQARADAKELALRIERMSVRAPFDGVVVKTWVEPGQWVMEGGPVAELVDLHILKVVASLPEQYRGHLQMDQDIQVQATALANQTFTGTIYAVIPDANTQTRSIPVKILIENQDRTLHSGMDMRVALPVSEPREALLVHKDAILTQGETYSVFTVAEGKAVPVPVVRKESFGDWVEVEGRLKEGDPVVIRGNERIRPGQDLQPRSLTPAS